MLSPFSFYPFPSLPPDLQPLEDSPQLRVTGGITFCTPPPYTLKEAVLDPIHTATYIMFMLSACALFSKTCIEIPGSGPRDVSAQLKGQQMIMAGHREGSMYKELRQVIPTAAAFGEVIFGLLSGAADLSNAIGSGTEVFMVVTIIDSYWEIGMRESGGPEMAAFGDLLVNKMINTAFAFPTSILRIPLLLVLISLPLLSRWAHTKSGRDRGDGWACRLHKSQIEGHTGPLDVAGLGNSYQVLEC
ncbi:hypothetical protein CVT25_008298 [Psilocybe cyanescens]|uniref:Uncharacterized protein n=1 Tax=Psilocybe cyanescens TaxID=93625 RepID=A0A409XJM2_PSICY|nr:hypothetical protein CVT25_008298 [Psilocybe cyanescens]